MVIISPKLMFDQMIAALQLLVPTYTHAEIFEAEYIACIEFYLDVNVLIADGEPKKLCGSPASSQQAAEEDAALQAIQFMESDLNIHLHDFNFTLKEDLFNENRKLLKKIRKQS
uniref:DRBM domain-containing protein n=1 Tax=Arundo donax TaxID=35708 RepID=A0A0A9F4W2_ARUDO